MEGWIKLHRKTMSHYLFTENRVFSKFEAWMYIIMSANHCDNKFLLGNDILDIKAGQFVTSQKKLMYVFGWSKSKLIKFLELLKKDEMIDFKCDKKKTTLTVVKYSLYQETKTTKRPQKATNKNVKNDIKKKEPLLSEIKISDVEDNLKPYFTIAVNFQKLFITNLKEKDAPTKHQESATFKNYVNPIRLMVENKECTIENLREVYKFLDSSKGEFWKTNILSTSKLREKITTLVMASKAKENKFKEDKL